MDYRVVKEHLFLIVQSTSRHPASGYKGRVQFGGAGGAL